MLVFAMAGAAVAQNAPPDAHRSPIDNHRMMMQRADQNGDGMISYDEAIESLPGMTEDRFKQMDANGDGQLGGDELPARGERRDSAARAEAAHARFDSMDKNKDGKLSQSEVKSYSPRFSPERFAAMDANGDGTLSFEEVAQNRTRGESSGGGHRGPGPNFIARLDTDGNGEVSLDEFKTVRPEMSEERFSRLDADKSGGVTVEELRAAAANRPSPAEREAFMNRVFARLDADNSGGLSFEEMKNGRRPITEERFGQLDANGDGSVSKDEFMAGPGRRGPSGDTQGHRHQMPSQPQN